MPKQTDCKGLYTEAIVERQKIAGAYDYVVIDTNDNFQKIRVITKPLLMNSKKIFHILQVLLRSYHMCSPSLKNPSQKNRVQSTFESIDILYGQGNYC
jgi:hypothetical protein